MGLILDIRNPVDLVSTYDQIEISRSATEGGSYSVLNTVSIDTSTAGDLTTGYTSYTDSTGTTSYWYKFRYKASGSGTFSEYSDEFQGGTTTIETRFRRAMRDTKSSNYFFSNEDVAQFARDAVFSLWPYTWYESIDESLTTQNAVLKYPFPVGVTRVDTMEFLDSSGVAVGQPSYWNVRSRQIIFSRQPVVGYTMRLYVDKMFTKLSEVPEVFDSYILDSMMLSAYQVLEADRSRFYKYNAVVKSEGGNLPSLRQTMDRLSNKVSKRRGELKRSRRPADTSFA